MWEFAMCAECRRKYEDPADRRFHAEPIACGGCGPTMYIKDASGKVVASVWDAICRALESLKTGKILAVKGVGGYHVVCDAINKKSVATLLSRKYREDEPICSFGGSLRNSRPSESSMPDSTDIAGTEELHQDQWHVRFWATLFCVPKRIYCQSEHLQRAHRWQI